MRNYLPFIKMINTSVKNSQHQNAKVEDGTVERLSFERMGAVEENHFQKATSSDIRNRAKEDRYFG